VKTLIVVLLTARFGFSGVDSVSALKMQEFGVPKELMASMSAALMPIVSVASLHERFWATAGHACNGVG